MMLDLLAAVQSVNPMSVPLWAIVAFAAGMYPVGFLFGFACGACCEQCNSNRCHFHECCGGYACRPIPEYASFDNTIAIAGLSSTTVDYETNWYLIGQKSIGVINFNYQGEAYEIDRVEFWFYADSLQVANKCDVISGNECQYTLKFKARFFRFSQWLDIFDSVTDPVNWFYNGECAAKDETISLGPFLWNSTIPEISDYLEPITGSASVSYEACECGACCEGNINQPAQCQDNVVQHLCDGDIKKWRGADTTCEEDGCDESACCTYDGCVPVLFDYLCYGTYLPGTDCDPDPCA